MSEGSAIEWTNHTFNPWWGCSKVSPGCAHCYAEGISKRWGGDIWGKTAGRRFFGDDHWAEPLKWNRKAESRGVRARVFCASMADVFEDHPDVGDARKRLWDLIGATPWLDWQLLTKRPENVWRMVPGDWLIDWPNNVWLGTSVEDQDRAEQRIHDLIAVPATVRFLSIEPLLGPVDLTDGLGLVIPSVHWVIVGGESGPQARPMHPQWARSIRDQCVGAGVPFFFKQWGEWLPGFGYGGHIRNGQMSRTRWEFQSTHFTPEGEVYDGKSMDLWLAGTSMLKVGKHKAGRELDGRTWDEFPPSVFDPAELGRLL